MLNLLQRVSVGLGAGGTIICGLLFLGILGGCVWCWLSALL